MLKADLPVLREAMAQPLQPLKIAHLQCNGDTFAAVAQNLPEDASPKTVAEVFEFVAKMHPCYQIEEVRKLVSTLQYVDAVAPGLTLADRMMFQLAPIPWRDKFALTAIARIMSLYHTQLRVDLQSALQQSGMWKLVQDALEYMKGGKRPPALLSVLLKLESIHKITTLYLWLSYRMPLAFDQQEQCFELKKKIEGCINWCLDGLTKEGKDLRMRYSSSLNSPLALKKNQIKFQSLEDRTRDIAQRREQRFRERQRDSASSTFVIVYHSYGTQMLTSL